MEDIILYTGLSLVIFLLLAFQSYHSKTRVKNLPPSPPSSLPIIGHLHLIKPSMHHHFHQLAQKYGKVFSLRFGSRMVVVVSSLSAVKECFTKNDIVFANRPRLLMGKHVGYNHSTVLVAPYGEHWRNLRRIGALEIYSSQRLNLFLSIRKDEIKRLLQKLYRNSSKYFAKVELKSMFNDLTFNIVMRKIAGKRYYDDDSTNEQEAKQVKDLIAELFFYSGASNGEDFLPILNWIKLGLFEKKLKRFAKKTDTFLQRLVDEHRNKKDLDLSMDTMIGHLLSLQEKQPDYYTDEIIKGFVLVMLLAGSDTSAMTLEWAMSNLANHPSVLQKAKAELDAQLFGQDRLIEESDLPNLPYLHSIILETLRLHPPAPLLVPHMATDDCTIEGYNIPCDTMLLINAWAIQRDPELWDDPTTFRPERFEVAEEEQKLIPFGLGRRACPGADMAHRVIGLALGSFIQCFEWKRVSEKEVDMTEGKGITMPKAEPLELMCKARPIMNKVLFDGA